MILMVKLCGDDRGILGLGNRAIDESKGIRVFYQLAPSSLAMPADRNR
jgi:hypothetical protein